MTPLHTTNTLRRAFTLVEMIVVITIITILLLVIVPSFNAMIYSSEQSLAENLLRTSVRSGRDAAIRSGAGRDAGVVFLYDPQSQRTQIVTCVSVGVLRDADPDDSSPNAFIARDVFVPVGDLPVITLPKGWMVRAFVPPDFIPTGGTGDDWYASGTYTPDAANWVFPETGFFDVDADGGGITRNSFLVRFEAGTGRMIIGSAASALVLVPSPDATARNSTIPDSLKDSFGLDRLDSAETYVSRVLAAGQQTISLNDKRRLLGRQSPDMVLCRPVGQIALYDEGRLADTLGARIDPVSGCLYQRPQYIDPANGTVNDARLVTGITQTRINRWIQGDTSGDGGVSEADATNPDRPEAKLYAIDRYTGALQPVEVQP